MIRVTFLEISYQEQIVPPKTRLNEFCVMYIATADQANKIHRQVAIDQGWKERLDWTHIGWRDWVKRPDITPFMFVIGNSAIGYAEARKQEDNMVQITKFGIIKDKQGKGFGGYALFVLLNTIFQTTPSTTKIWLMTTSLDHPNAIRNYQSRGMCICKEADVDLSVLMTGIAQ